MKNSLQNCSVHEALQHLPNGKRYCVALSGGMDSVVLLHALVNSVPDISRVFAVHVHHGLSENADDWQSFCEKLCAELGIELRVEKVTVSKAGQGWEAAARKARYLVFERNLRQGDLLLQGHHLNDQAETVLFRFFRGVGVGRIPDYRALKNGALFRPLLRLKRRELWGYAKRHNLKWCEDESNQDNAFDRNFIRNEVLPLLASRWPKILEQVEKVSLQLLRSQQFIEEWCEEQYAEVSEPCMFVCDVVLSLESLKKYSLVRQQALVRFWIDQIGAQQPSSNIFERIWSEVISARQDAQPEICYQGWVLRRHQECLYCVRREGNDPQSFFERVLLQDFQEDQAIVLPDAGLLLEWKEVGAGVYTQPGRVCLLGMKPGQSLVIRSRSGGEKLCLSSDKRTALKKLYQQVGVPVWMRDSFPLIYCEGELVASLAGFVGRAYAESLPSEKCPQADSKVLVLTFRRMADQYI